MGTESPAAAPRRRVSAVIVTWNSESVIAACLESLMQSAGNLDLEVFVIDNDSRDRTVDVAREVCPSAQVIRNPTNRGLAAANNQGLRLSTGDPVLICNPDVVFHPGAVEEMIAVMDRRPTAGWVVPRLVYEDGTVQTTVGDLPTLWETVLGRQLSRRRGHEGSGFWWDAWDHDEERAVGRGHEAAYMVRRAALDQVGLQDERYVLDWEGPDWTSRFRAAGWEVWISPGSDVLHLGGVSIRQARFRWIVSCHRGMYMYFADRRPARWRPVLAAVFAVRAAAKTALVASGVPMYQWAHRDRRRSGTPSPGLEEDRPPAD